jgi:hypothetical protein
MKIFVLAALFALGAVLVAPSGASAAPISGTSNAVSSSSLLEPVYYACRNVRVCHSYYYGRRCYWRRVCRQWY